MMWYFVELSIPSCDFFLHLHCCYSLYLFDVLGSLHDFVFYFLGLNMCIVICISFFRYSFFFFFFKRKTAYEMLISDWSSDVCSSDLLPKPPPEPARPSRRKRMVTVAIDPGHGGEDPGAIGKTGLREKDVVLRIARRLKALIDDQPNMRAYLTRDDDYFVPLHVRVQKARRVRADLFISIHADAWVKPSASGSSVFALSQHGASSAQARWLEIGRATV